MTATTAALAMASSGAAWAQGGPAVEERAGAWPKLAAPAHAFEIGVSSGYVRPFGDLAQGRRIGAIADGGLGAGLELGYRVSPRWGLSWAGQYHESNPADELRGDNDVRGLSTSIQGTLHLAPYERVDPYLTAGAGYRFLGRTTDGPGNDRVAHGFQLAKLQAGIDARITPEIAVGPYVAGDLDLFVWDNPEGPRGNVEIGDTSFSTFFSVGVQGRFDLGGTRRRDVTATPYIAAEVPPGTPPEAQALPMTDVGIEANLAAACGIAQPSAFFHFDSANVRVEEAATLSRLASCLTAGPLRGHRLEVIGYADPRGTDAYNRRLGRSRAEAVAAHLSTYGLPQGHIMTRSVGEEYATGTGPRGWALDRRVDIRIAR